MPSLLEALEQKYFSDYQFDDFNFNDDRKTAKAKRSISEIKDEQRLISIFTPKLPPLLSVPELLVLNDCDIDCAGDFETIREKCQRVRELDLAQNKLQDWQEVFQILRHMPRIEFLNLSKNHLVGPIMNPYASIPFSSVSNLRAIVLNGTYLSWLCLDVLLDKLPNLEELHLSLNNYHEVLIDAPASEQDNKDNLNNSDVNLSNHNDLQLNNEPEFPAPTTTTGSADCPNCLMLKQCKTTKAHRALKTLHFTGNPIEHWQEICRLGRVFPSIETLVLADCPIRAINLNCDNCAENNSTPSGVESATPTIAPDSNKSRNSNSFSVNDEPPHKYFANLKLLNLSSAKINTWNDIDQLAEFPNLTNLRVKNWPLWHNIECTEHERRQLLIARLPNVKLLNGGGVISADEREDAERAFIRYYMDKPDWERPRRYDELLAKHGKLDPLVNINLKPDKRVKIFITFRDKTEPRYVDVYRTVADLKLKLEKVLGIAANKMRLFYLDKDFRELGPEIMKYPNKMLYSYNIQAEDEIIVDEKK